MSIALTSATPALADASSPVTNHGGPIMTDPTIHLVFWAPSTLQDGTSSGSFDQSYIDGLKQFFQDVGGHGLVNMLRQYPGNNGEIPSGVKFGDVFVDHTPFPHQGCSFFGIGDQNCLVDQQLRDELEHLQDHGGTAAIRGLNDLYFLFLPKGERVCTSGGLFGFGKDCSGQGGKVCAYHGRDTFFFGPDIYYAAMPLGGSECAGNMSYPHGPELDPEISSAFHELVEAITDPQTQAPIRGNGWFDSNSPAEEIADKCENLAFPNVFDNGSADEFWNGHYYEVEGVWDQQAGRCVWQDPQSPLEYRPGCGENELAANDDGSTSSVLLPFTLNFFGKSYSSLFVNNNGNVTFEAPLATYTPFGLTATNTPIIAPFFADVDTRGAGSGFVTYGAGGIPGDRSDPPYFCVDWFDVGYYGEHTDKTNSFQLVLTDRSAQTGVPGDFDIVFNYDRVRWETGDASGGVNGFGGSSAVVGFSNGATRSLELTGSAINGAFLDGGLFSLASGSQNSTTLGRYIFAVRNGANAGGSTIKGTVTDTSNPAVPVGGATLQVCTLISLSVHVCATATTNAQGNYSVTSLPAGLYLVTVSPPSTSALFEKVVGPVALSDQGTVVLNVALERPHGVPAGTAITSLHVNTDGTPVLDWNTTNTLTTHGCVGGSASYIMTIANNQYGSPVSGGITESPAGSGSYTATIPALRPQYGPADVVISITCPNPSQNQTIKFSVYVDPAGSVVDTHGNPVAGATVTLYRSDAEPGPFTPVPADSTIMSPANRANPDKTTSMGRFGWDVLQGYYTIRASKTGCSAPGNLSQTYVESPVEQIPPAVDNLVLTLQCQVVATMLTLAPKTGNDRVGTTHTVVAKAKDASGDPAVGVSVVFSVTGANNAHGTVTTDSNGEARFAYAGTHTGFDSISAFADNNANGTQDVGEPSDTASELWYGLLSAGSFVIGDKNAAIGSSVTLWGAQWWKLNSLSGGSGPASFKGFENSPATAVCGKSWRTNPSNSAPPPVGPLPEYLAVIVSNKVSKSGPTISGNTIHEVVVKTNPGYAPNPGHAGTGRVVAQIC